MNLLHMAVGHTSLGLIVALLLCARFVGAETEVEVVPAVTATGGAVLIVPFDSIRLDLELKTKASTFEKAKAQADEHFESLRKYVEAKKFPGHDFHYGFSLVGQSGLSIGERGSEIVHQLAVVVSGPLWRISTRFAFAGATLSS